MYAIYLSLSVNSFLLKNNGLHVEIIIDRTSTVGKSNATGIKDVILESAVTAICDLEDRCYFA